MWFLLSSRFAYTNMYYIRLLFAYIRAVIVQPNFVIREEKTMTKKLNIGIIMAGLVAQFVGAVLYHLGKIANIDTYILVTAIITALLFLIANSLHNWFKGTVLAVLTLALLFGVGKFSVMLGYTGTYFVAQSNNLSEIHKIKNNENFTHVMSYNDKDYYVDNGYTYLYVIENNGLLSSISANSIMIGSDAEESFKGFMGEFYEVNNNEHFSNITNIKVAIALVKNARDDSVFIKLINADKKVFYSYLTIDDTVSLLTDMNIVQETIPVGSLNLVLTKPTKIIDGTTTSDGDLSYENGKQYLITAGSKLFLSDVSVLSFEKDNGFWSRVNYYMYREYFAEIEKSKAELDKMDPETEDYKELQSYIESLENSMDTYSVELCYEVIKPDKTIRIYRSFIKKEQLESVPDMTVIEIDYGENFVYAMTDISLDELK